MGLTYLKDYDNFCVNNVNEALLSAGAERINKAFLEHGPIELSNGEYINPKDILNVVHKAISEYLAYEWGSFFSFAKNATIIYIWNDRRCKTMCVDEHLNIYMDVLFIYRDLKMDYKLVGAVILHEIFHVVYNHIERGKNWLNSKGLPLNKKTHMDNNLAADVEVNTTLVRKHVISADKLLNEINGVYLKQIGSNVMPMEEILENETLMNELRNMLNDDDNDNGEKKNNNEEKNITTTTEFDNAYVEMSNKIVDIVNKYGPEEALEKLREIGAVYGVNPPTVSSDVNFDDIFSLSLLQLKSFDEFVNESNNNGGNGYETKEDGYRKALEKIIDEISSSLNGGGDNGGGDDNTNINHNIKDGDIKKMNLPNSGKKSKSGGKQLPNHTIDSNNKNQNSENGGSNGNDSKENQNSENGGSNGNDSKENQNSENGGSNGNDSKENQNGKKEDRDITITYKGENKSNDAESKTGTFVDSEDDNNPLKDIVEKCYGEELSKEIIKEVEKNKVLNSKEAIEKKKQDMYNNLSDGDIIKITLDKARESEKAYRSMWKKLLKNFLKTMTRRAGDNKEDNNIKWGEKRHMSIGVMSPINLKSSQEPQYINVYVDVSGSVTSNMELMELFAESLVSFMKEFKYSGINIIPWASKSNGIHRVDSVKKGGGQKAVSDIIGYIENGTEECGGGTELIYACVPQIISTTFQYKRKISKMDDAHIILSDGFVGYDVEGIENTIKKGINQYQNVSSSTVADKVVKNCIWMIYDNDDERWDENINSGTLVRISSKNFK